MSYKQFTLDLNEFYKDDRNKGAKMEVGLAYVRDIWMKDGRYDELIDFVLENWDSGNCDEFIEPFETKLISESHLNRFKRLWRKIIYYRLTKLLNFFGPYMQEVNTLNLEQIENTDLSDFNVFSTESYKDTTKVVAYHRQFTLRGVKKYKHGLMQLKAEDELKQLELLELGVKILDKSKMNPRNWR